MVSRELYASKWVALLLVSGLLVSGGCASSENLSAENGTTPSTPQQQENRATTSNDGDESSGENDIIVTYTNRSSNIQIKLDPKKDQFYMDLSGMTPQEKDSVVVKDSTLIKNRAIDIQTLLSSYRKAQDLFYLGEYRQALEEVDKTIEIQETADAYALKGTIFFMLENITAARANWNRAVQMDPNIPVPSIPELETLIDEIRGEGN
ncbi:MAG: tetratricopeptide repeat protein [Balneola sp.]|nr:MAG: tetratricopeptide repeat protein [Balneola sp.]